MSFVGTLRGLSFAFFAGEEGSGLAMGCDEEEGGLEGG